MTSIQYGNEKPAGYIPRLVDKRIARYLDLFGAVEIRGTKWCGKTWSAKAFGESTVCVDSPAVKPLVESDPTLALQGARPHVIDEWQEVPAIWDTVRHAVDKEQGAKGSYLLTGSSTPEKDKVSHSGAGRIARVDMNTMTLWELGESSGQVSLSGLFKGEFAPSLCEEMCLERIAQLICRGGWPELRARSCEDAAETINQYLDALFEISVPRKGGETYTARRMAQALVRNVGTAAKLETLAADALEAENAKKPANSTVSFYLSLFRDLFFMEDLYGWDAPVRSRSRVRTKPKRYFADPSLAASLLGVNPHRLLQDGQTFGVLFESLCLHDIATYASLLPEATRDPVRYYQDADGLEVDIIIELRSGEWAGIEVKLGESKVPTAIENLQRLRAKVAANPAARNPEPTFMAVVTAVSPFARYDHENDVYVFPLSALRE